MIHTKIVSVTCVVLIAMSSFAWAAGGQEDSNAGSGQAASDTVSTVEARVEYIEGDVLLDGEPTNIGAEVPPGGRIETGADGLVDVVFGNGNALRIEENTALTMDLSDPSQGLDVRRGTVAAVFEGLRSIGVAESDDFRVRTPTAVAGVRGTAFFVRVENENSTYICTCHGELDFGPHGMTIRAARHDARRFIREGGEVRVEQAPEIYHDSDSLNAVADVVGVTIAWGEEPD
jgi:hypothetical protein